MSEKAAKLGKDHVSLQEKARKTVKSQRRLQHLSDPAQAMPDPEGRVKKGDDGQISLGSLTGGRYVKSNTAMDDKWQKFEQVAGSQPAAPQVQLPFGEYYEYVSEKEDQIAQLKFLELGAQLIDTRDPSTQEAAYSVLPELKSVPDAYFQEKLKQQLLLRHMILSGRVTSREELNFLYVMIGDDYELPTEPLWDLDGIVKRGGVNKLPSSDNRGLFSPLARGPFNTGGVDFSTGSQANMKAQILQRVLPNLRDKTTSEIVAFIAAINQRRMQSYVPGKQGVPGAGFPGLRGL